MSEEDSLAKIRYSADVERTLSQYRKYQGGATNSNYKIGYAYMHEFSPEERMTFDYWTTAGLTREQAYEQVMIQHRAVYPKENEP